MGEIITTVTEFLSNVFKGGFLNKPGDELNARVTDTNRKVLKARSGNEKYSVTEYPNGTRVETKTTRKK